MVNNNMLDQLFVRFDGAFSENTLRAYRSDFQQYEAWCVTNRQPSLPATADLIAEYVDYMTTKNKSATIRRRINSLGTIFKLSKHPDPTKEPEVVLALKRMHRKIGRRQKQAPPSQRTSWRNFWSNAMTTPQVYEIKSCFGWGMKQ